jgi:hypothetical protein
MGIVQPYPLSLKLISRVLVAFTSAGFGSLVGKSVHVAIAQDRSAIGHCLATTALQILIAGIGGAVTVLLLNYNGM